MITLERQTDRDRKRYRETVSHTERQKEIQRDRHKEKKYRVIKYSP